MDGPARGEAPTDPGQPRLPHDSSVLCPPLSVCPSRPATSTQPARCDEPLWSYGLPAWVRSVPQASQPLKPPQTPLNVVWGPRAPSRLHPSTHPPLPPVGPIAPVGWGGDLHCWGRLGLHFVSSSGGLSRFPGSRCFTCRRRRTQDVLGTSAHVHAVSTLSSQPPCRSRSPSSCTTAKLHNCTTSAPAAAPVSRCLPRYRYLGRLALTSLEGPRIRQTCPRQQHPTSTPSTYLPTLPNLPLSLRLPPCPRRILPAWTGCLAAPVADLY